MKRFLIFAILILVSVAGVLFVALKLREPSEVPTPFIGFTNFEKREDLPMRMLFMQDIP